MSHKPLNTIAGLLRVEHWVKNLFLFIPAFFAARLHEPVVFLRVTLGFLAFSLVASGVYILNDLVDAPQDRLHPDKKNRPIASGAVTPRQAIVALLLVLGGGTALAGYLGVDVLALCLLYFTVNLFYSFSLKQIAIVDITTIAVGFLLRVFAGGAAAGVEVSQWLLVMTFLLALILGLAKRRGEFLVAQDSAVFRKALEGYNLPFLDMSMVVCSTVSIVAYLMYCFSPEVEVRIGSDKIYYTAVFVVIGVLRYLQLTLVYNKTESPTRALLRDGFLQLVLLGWVGAFVWLLYLKS
ncbi:MAG: decaprenyl-phosphate phosphoribosyltransferase [Saprospiraceae bacterium]